MKTKPVLSTAAASSFAQQTTANEPLGGQPPPGEKASVADFDYQIRPEVFERCAAEPVPALDTIEDIEAYMSTISAISGSTRFGSSLLAAHQPTRRV
jgi:hypothetical protein